MTPIKYKNMNTAVNNDFYQKAMLCGTILGGVWSVMYLLLFAGTTSMPALYLCMFLFFASPVIAVMLATNYRRKECDNAMSYLQAWIFIFYMYLCASLLSALVSFIYFRFLDSGMFFMTLQGMLAEITEMPNADAALVQQMQEAAKVLEQTTPTSFVWQLMSNNFMNATIIPLILAIFVRKKRETSNDSRG